MEMKLSVCTTVYIGPREQINNKMNSDPLFYLREQLKSFDKQTKSIDRIYVVCTFHESVDSDELYTQISDFLSDRDDVVLSTRENLGGSYASFHQAIQLDENNSDLMFFIEDDHLFGDEKSLETILEYFEKEPDIFYLCEWWDTKTYSNIFYGDRYTIPQHAGISNGMININLYWKGNEEKDLDFRLHYGKEKQSMWLNQAQFLEDFRSNGYKMKDWSADHSSYFIHSDMDYGNPNGIKIAMPII